MAVWHNREELSLAFQSSKAETRRVQSRARLEDLAGKWMKICTSIDEFSDQVVLEQLLNMLPEDACIFVKEKKPKTSMEAARLADDYITGRKDEVAEKEEKEKAPDYCQSHQCGKCWKLGHLAWDYRQSQLKLEHEKDKGDAARKPKRDLKDIKCFHCHQKSHYAFNCPIAMLCSAGTRCQSWWERGQGLVLSWSVKEGYGHHPPDTGFSRMLVHQEWVPRGRVLDREEMGIHCVHGTQYCILL